MLTHAQSTYSLNDDSAFIKQFETETLKTTNDSIKAYNYLKLSTYYRLISDTVKAKAYLAKGVLMSQPYPLLRGAAYYYQAHEHSGKLDIPFMELCLKKADSVLKDLKSQESLMLLSMIWHKYGVIQQMKGDERAAIGTFTTKAAVYADLSDDIISKAKVNKAIAIINMNAREWKKATTYFQRSIQYLSQSPNNNPIYLEELVDTYLAAAVNHAYTGSMDSSKKLIQKAKNILQPYPRSNLMFRYYFTEGTYYDRIAQYDEALNSFSRGISLAKYYNDQHAINKLKSGLHDTYVNKGDYPKAVELMEELIQSSSIVEQDKVKCYKKLYQDYAALGNAKKSVLWAKKYITLNDSINTFVEKKDILEIERRYNDAENKRQIALLQTEKEKAIDSSKNNRLLSWLLGITSIFFLCLFFVGRLYFKNAQKLAKQKEINYRQQLQEAEQRQQTAFAKALLDGEEKERKRLAGDLHDGLGGILSGVKMNLSRLVDKHKENHINNDLLKVIDQLDISVRELRRIAHNMMPESLVELGLEASLRDMCHQYVTVLTWIDFQAINISTKIPTDIQVTIYRIVQELLTNAIRHSDASEILVQCSQNNDQFFITVEDNGKGFNASSENKYKGIGLLNIKRRVEYLAGKLEISSEIGKGTDINIEFNVSEK